MTRKSNSVSKITQKRKKAGYKQEELAKLIGVYQQQLSEWERGNVQPGIKHLKKLSEVFHCTVDDLI